MSPAGRSPTLRRLRAAILVAALLWVGWMIVKAWRDVERGALVLEPDLRWLAVSALAVFAAYVVLIWSWRFLLRAIAGTAPGPVDGARIWFISNLGTLLPGRIWGILQMGAMSAEAGADPVAASAAAVVNAAVNIATGMAVGVVAGRPILASIFGGWAWVAWPLAIAAIAGVALLPVLLPIVFRVAHRRFGIAVPAQGTPAGVIVVTALANGIAWIAYGIAFQALAWGLIGDVGGSTGAYIAAFATSYVIGYLAIIVPLGMGARELALVAALTVTGLLSNADANALSVFSRFWLLIIQVLPALLFLAYRRRRPDEIHPTAG